MGKTRVFFDLSFSQNGEKKPGKVKRGFRVHIHESGMLYTVDTRRFIHDGLEFIRQRFASLLGIYSQFDKVNKTSANKVGLEVGYSFRRGYADEKLLLYFLMN